MPRMSAENVERVKRFLAAYNDRDYETLRAMYHPSGEWHGRATQMDGPRVLHGPDALVERTRHRDADFDEFRTELQELIDGDERIVAVFEVIATGRQSGASVRFKDASVWTFSNGLISRVEICATRDEALQLAGIAE